MAFQYWHFQSGADDIDVSRDPYIGAGLMFGPIDFVSSTTLVFSSEASIMQFQTGETVLSSGANATASLEIRALPMMVWSTLAAPGRFGPFVRAGLGATMIDFAERYTVPGASNVEFDYWAFTVGLSAGVHFRPSGRFEFWVYGEDLLALRDRTELRSNGVRTGFFRAPNFDSLNIRLIVWM
jgi:hypothetical protein